MYKVEHIGIAVKNLSVSVPLYEQLLNTNCYKKEAVETEGVQTAFYLTGASKIELLESLQSDGVIARFIEQKGEGLHHIAFEVPDIRAEMSRLKAAGFRLLSDEPKRGADNKWVCFVHPKSAGGVLVELCEEIKE
jgi:methylmalonyl-CoA/ethylmalonyl-CoA epimerase